MSKSQVIARDVVRVPTGISNAYLIGPPERWALIDAGMPGKKKAILRAVREHLGEDAAAPGAIVLTHGHFDHSGSAAELAEHWGVPIYVHRLEMPFVDGRECYPSPDPTVGGFSANMMRFFPNVKINLTPHVREFVLRELPWVPGWQIVETPGHTAGHVSFFRPSDATLIVGDAFTTINQDNPFALVTKRPQVSRPPAYFTPDWQKAEISVRRLAELHPKVIGAGHGVPMAGALALEELRELARNFPAPDYGRYVLDPARSDEQGITYMPPPVADRVKRRSLMSLAAVTGVALGYWIKRRQKTKPERELSRWREVA